MKLKEIVEKLQLKVLTARDKLDEEVTGGYTSDLLSDVIANSKQGNLWITLQTHQNTIAVAKLKDLAGIIIVNNREPDEETLAKAKEENVPLLCSEEMAFEVSGKLYELINP
ncbi:MAG: serine kinase [Candidatus Aminicenantes bacterium]|nr:MAG: serine kinase [Candidatus Aminicenantes bacterium]